MKPVASAVAYHERTKHHPNRYAASLGYMDWATQPDPFRRYEGATLQRLPLVLDAPTPGYDLLFVPGALPAAALDDTSLSALLQFSLGLAAWKSIGTDRWALRCNASSGNLHPTEAYLVLPPQEGSRTRVAHYAPKEHALELLAECDTGFWETLPEGSFLLLLNAVLWREAWKYGERAFRYCQLDAGHARRAVEVSAAMLGWEVTRLDADAATLACISGADRHERFVAGEEESADMALLITPRPVEALPDLDSLMDALPRDYAGSAKTLSPSHHPWEAITHVEAATREGGSGPSYRFAPSQRRSAMEAGEVVLRRRSAQAMDFGRTAITQAAFDTLMASVQPETPEQTPVHFVLFIHDVEGLERGLYLMARNPGRLEALRSATRSDFLWSDCGGGLYLLEAGDFRNQARFISCSQDIAADSAFSLGMLCEFDDQLQTYGARRYRELFVECGAIGQQLYLEATALQLSATGIGCFLDDVLHRMLGLEGTRFQSLYHFTIGRAIVDMRLSTLPPYYHLGVRGTA